MSEPNPDLSALGLDALLSQLNQPKAEPLMHVLSNVLTKFMQDDDDGGAKRQISKLGKTLRRLKVERDLLVERNRAIALGLGACECWGTNMNCRRCGGVGVPGYFFPEEAAFVELVLPLLQSRMDLITSYLQELDPLEAEEEHKDPN